MSLQAPVDATTDDGLMTVDALAAATGVPVRTIRFYTGKKLLPPPHMRGRTGLYDSTHLATLGLIRDLQGHGFTLAAVEAILDRLPEDPTPADFELYESLVAPWPIEETEVLEIADFAARFGSEPTEEHLERLEAGGLLDRIGPERVRVSTRILSMLEQAAEFDPPPQMLTDAVEAVASHARELADELTDLFEDAMLRPSLGPDRTSEDRERVQRAADVLRTVTVQLLTTSFQRAVTRVMIDRRNRPRLGG